MAKKDFRSMEQIEKKRKKQTYGRISKQQEISLKITQEKKGTMRKNMIEKCEVEPDLLY